MQISRRVSGSARVQRMDPLSVLRDYATRGHLEKVTRTTTAPAEIHFLNPNTPSATAYTFPATAETPYRSKQGTPYTLDSLLFFLKNHHLKHTDYLQSARNLSIPAVTFTDRKPLLDFLLSKSSSSSLPILPPLPLPDEPLLKRPDLADPNPSDNRAPKEGGGDANDYNAIVDVMAMIKAVERPLKDREGILLCRNRDFYSVLVSSTKREEERQRMERQQRKDGLVAKSRLMGAEDRGLGLGLGFGGGGEELAGFGDVMGSSGGMGSSGAKSKLGFKKVGGEGVPIILVPSAFQTLITIYNVKEFLEDGVYVPTEVKVKGMGKKPEVVTVQKKFASSREKGGVMAAYEVRDKVTGLKADDWERVIAAFVLGKEWQFKDWPFKDHVEIFNKILGFYLRFEDDSVESAKNVKQWNVKIISISKNKRHQDRAAALEVWDRLEEFMRARARA